MIVVVVVIYVGAVVLFEVVDVVVAVAVVDVADVGSIVDVTLFSIKDSKNVPGGHNCHGNQKCLLTLKQQQDNLANLTISTKRK